MENLLLKFNKTINHELFITTILSLIGYSGLIYFCLKSSQMGQSVFLLKGIVFVMILLEIYYYYIKTKNNQEKRKIN